ncbi:MAG TPA: heme ABC exporter ATP-binding protein CcmA [Dongiaceae bacterium]|jgi:heme exporter protein A|nr:heme ABC exporter ATP-binding protein CcmA [Dongiaceae bacterium]
MLEARDIACQRAGRIPFAPLSFTLCPGEALLVTGANGSGKTSLLRLLAGLLPGEGSLNRPEPVVYLGHRDGLKRELSVSDNLSFWRALWNDRHELDAALALFGIAPLKERKVQSLSAGQRKRVDLSRLALCAAPLILLDEPNEHLDDEGVFQLVRLLEELRGRQSILVVAAHGHLPLAFSARVALS